MTDQTPTRPHRTSRDARKDARELWLPVGAVITALAFIGGAASLWSADRAELARNSDAREDHEGRLRRLEQALMDRVATEREILNELRHIRRRMEGTP